ncbi:MAG: zf-TFIIB domain-containing protein [Bauldia sp.]|nr:zf-TFIIB domain-containing protein [Bauldia sp.]
MLCPVCRVTLTMAERQGIEIDYCPNCRGVWLDRGELDRIIERSAPAPAAPQAAPGFAQPPPAYAQPGYGQPADPGYRQDHGRRYRDDDDDDDDRRGRRRGGFLSDIFDF